MAKNNIEQIQNSIGLNTEPWGMMNTTSYNSDKVLATKTQNDLLNK